MVFVKNTRKGSLNAAFNCIHDAINCKMHYLYTIRKGKKCQLNWHNAKIPLILKYSLNVSWNASLKMLKCTKMFILKVVIYSNALPPKKGLRTLLRN